MDAQELPQVRAATIRRYGQLLESYSRPAVHDFVGVAVSTACFPAANLMPGTIRRPVQGAAWTLWSTCILRGGRKAIRHVLQDTNRLWGSGRLLPCFPLVREVIEESIVGSTF